MQADWFATVRQHLHIISTVCCHKNGRLIAASDTYTLSRQQADYSSRNRIHKRTNASAQTSWSKEMSSGDGRLDHHVHPPCSLPSILPTTLPICDLYRLHSNSTLPISRASVYGSAVLTWRRGRRTPDRALW